MTLKQLIIISIIGMFAGLIFCIVSIDSNIGFAIGFSAFIANLSMFYMVLKEIEELKN